ncbi:hypothetical protein ANCCAN_30025, partial [Ancylostoma caninum]
ISEELKQNWGTISQKQQLRKEGTKVETFPKQEAIQDSDPITCLKNFTNSLRAAIEGRENSTEKLNPTGDPTSSTEKTPSSNEGVGAASRKTCSRKYKEERLPLPKELQDHDYAAPPPVYSQKSDEKPMKTTKKRKKAKAPMNDKSLRPTPAYLKMRAQQAQDYTGDLDLQLNKELVGRRLLGGFAPCHFVLHGLSGPVEMQHPTSPKDLLEQINHLQNKSS